MLLTLSAVSWKTRGPENLSFTALVSVIVTAGENPLAFPARGLTSLLAGSREPRLGSRTLFFDDTAGVCCSVGWVGAGEGEIRSSGLFFSEDISVGALASTAVASLFRFRFFCIGVGVGGGDLETLARGKNLLRISARRSRLALYHDTD